MSQLVRNTKEFLISLVYLVLGLGALYICRDYDMGTAGKMGAAYFPTVLSYLLIAVGLLSLVRSFIKPGPPIGTFAVKGLLLVIAAIFLFGFIVRGAGLLVALPLLVIVSASASVKFKWKSTILMAVGITAFCILVFQHALGVPLPILGPWFGQ